MLRLTIRAFAIGILVTLTGITACSSKNQVKGKVLRLVVKDNVRSADPAKAYDEVTTDILPEIYETLFQFDYFAKQNNVVIPLLADGMPQISKDKLTYTIKIRKGVKYHDLKGREVKAQDFIYAWKRHADPAVESQGFWIFDGKIIGMSELAKNFDINRDIDGLKALDDYTLQIKLVKPYPQLMYVLCLTFSTPLPREVVEPIGKEINTKLFGTGPFKPKAWNTTSRVLLTRNEEYIAPTGQKPVALDGIEYNVLREEQPRWLGFLNKELDVIKIPKDNFNSAIVNATQVAPDLAASGVSVSIEEAMNFWYLTFNVKDKLLGSNKYLRQAIASSIDQKQWLAIFKNNRGTTQNELSPPPVVDRCGKPYRWTFDLARAKKLMEKAGYPEGKGLPTIQYDTRTTEMAERQLAEFISMSVAKIGVKLVINSNTFPAFLDRMNRGMLQMSKGGFIADYPDAENLLQLLYGPNKSPGPNDAQFDNPEYNKLYEKIAGMQPSPERKALICKAEEIIQEEVPVAYGIHENEYRLMQPWVKNYHTSEIVQNRYKYVDIDVAERDRRLAKK